MFDTVHIDEGSKYEIYSSEDMNSHSVYIQDELSNAAHDYAGLRVFLENTPTKGDEVRYTPLLMVEDYQQHKAYAALYGAVRATRRYM